MTQSQLFHNIIALSAIKGLRRKKALQILSAFECPEETDFITLIEYGIQIGVFQKKQPIGLFIEASQYADRVLKHCRKESIEIVSLFSPDYPQALRAADSPLLFYYKGDLSCLDNPKRAGVIGTRSPDQAGIEFVRDISALLSQNGYTVISGLARGCDSAAHRQTLESGGKTVAFVPSSVSAIVPKYNQQLADDIVAAGGLIVSEYAPFRPAHAGMYIARDKLIAQSSNMIFVSEFDRQSGTIQTLKFADALKKPIYTLRRIAENPDFDGYASLKNECIVCETLDWEAIHRIVTQQKGETDA